MASKKKKKANPSSDGNVEKNSGGAAGKIKIVVGVLGVIVLLFAGFLAGIYLKIFDQEEMNAKYGIYDWPIIGETFVRPEAQQVAETDVATTPKKDDPNKSKPIKLTKEEIDKQTKERQDAEKKRIGKLSRLYNEMKPAEAAKILTGLDDDMAIAIMQKMDEAQVSQILASEEYGAEHAAEVTRKMYQGTPNRAPTGNEGNAPPNAI